MIGRNTIKNKVVEMSDSDSYPHAREAAQPHVFTFGLCGVPVGTYPSFGVIAQTWDVNSLSWQQREVAHHLVEICTGGTTRRFKPPATFAATKPLKTVLLNPHQDSIHRPHLSLPAASPPLLSSLVTQFIDGPSASL
jgi:hypothetical protein